MKNINPAIFSIIQSLEESLSRIQYGETAVTLKVHAGRIVSVTYSVTENNRKPITEKETQRDNINGGNR